MYVCMSVCMYVCMVADVAAGQGLAEVEHISSDASIVTLTQEPDDPDTCQKALLFAVLVNLSAGCVLARAEIIGGRRDTEAAISLYAV